jgi:hypothetical protein
MRLLLYAHAQELSTVLGGVLPGGGRNLSIVAVLDTGMLWQWGGPGSQTSSPLLTSTRVHINSPAAPPSGLLLRQPDGAPPLQQGSRPRGFLNGAVRRTTTPLCFCSTSTTHLLSILARLLDIYTQRTCSAY